MLYAPPFRPVRRIQPVVLTDDVVRAGFQRQRIIMNDGIVPVEGRLIGWQRTDAGPLGAIFINPLTGERVLYGIDFATGRPRKLGRPKPPKTF